MTGKYGLEERRCSKCGARWWGRFGDLCAQCGAGQCTCKACRAIPESRGKEVE